MALSITSLTSFHEYLEGVMGRADHHAQNVNQIILTLIGAVIWRSDDFEVFFRNENTGNILWFEVNGHRYVVGYNHITENIEIRDRTLQGPVLITLNNSSDITLVKVFFERI